MWYLDSGYSKHMTGDNLKFSTSTPKSKGFFTYGDNNNNNNNNNKGKILKSINYLV